MATIQDGQDIPDTTVVDVCREKGSSGDAPILFSTSTVRLSSALCLLLPILLLCRTAIGRGESQILVIRLLYVLALLGSL